MSDFGFFEYLTTAIGAAVIALLLLALAVVGFIYWFYQTRIKHTLAQGQAYALYWLPPRLHLAPDKPEEKEKAERMSKRVDTFLSLGFQVLGRFIATNHQPLRLVALIHPDSGCCAVVYYLEGLGTWSDVLFPAHEEWISASNVKKRLHFLHLPGDRKFHEPNKTEAELVHVVLKTRQHSPAKLISSENFVEEYEAAFARASDVRMLEPLEDFQLRQLLRESRLVCDDEDEEISEKEFSQTKDAYADLIIRQLSSACALDFMRQNKVTASEWQRSRNRLLVVHDRLKLKDLRKLKTCEAHVTKPLKQLLKSSNAGKPRQAFAGINAKLSPRDRYTKLGSVEKPVHADIYRAPLDGFST